jgi:nucleotide-binding universal stress UspA family protein
MKNLLVPVGSSGNATNTLQYAIDFAKAIDAKIFVAQVYDSTRVSGSLKNIDSLLQDETKKELANTLGLVDKKGVEITSVFLKGQVLSSIERIAKEFKIDLIISSGKSISTDETLFLGTTAGSLVKDTEVPVLIVPAQYRFKSISKILIAIKSGKIKPGDVLEPLEKIVNTFSATIDLIQIITPKASDDEKEVSEDLKKLATNFKTTENATIFQGVLEHLHISEPDMLCVIRRKRGFFSKLWEKDTVKKSYFESRIPLLVLKGIV